MTDPEPSAAGLLLLAVIVLGVGWLVVSVMLGW